MRFGGADFVPDQTSFRFELLLDLAREPSGEKRRELLLQITDAFIANPAARTDKEASIFDDIFAAVATDLEKEVRFELARKIAKSQAPLNRTARRLAMDVIEVARPVVEHSPALNDDDLVDVIAQKGADHQVAVARRSNLSEEVSEALVDTRSDRVLHSLLSNPTARMDRPTFEKVAERASANPVLHAPFVRNHNVPLDLLNEIYLKVADQLRNEILVRFEGVSPGELEAALQVSRNRLSTAYGALPADFDKASQHIAALERVSRVQPPQLVDMLREGRRTAFLIAFSRIVDMEFGLVQRLVDAQDIDALALLCRSVSMHRSIFVSLSLIIGGERYGMTKANGFGQLYEKVPTTAAKRAVQFWKLRTRGMPAAVR